MKLADLQRTAGSDGSADSSSSVDHDEEPTAAYTAAAVAYQQPDDPADAESNGQLTGAVLRAAAGVLSDGDLPLRQRPTLLFVGSTSRAVEMAAANMREQ